MGRLAGWSGRGGASIAITGNRSGAVDCAVIATTGSGLGAVFGMVMDVGGDDARSDAVGGLVDDGASSRVRKAQIAAPSTITDPSTTNLFVYDLLEAGAMRGSSVSRMLTFCVAAPVFKSVGRDMCNGRRVVKVRCSDAALRQNANENRRPAIFARQTATCSYNFHKMLQIGFLLALYFLLVTAVLAFAVMPSVRSRAVAYFRNAATWLGLTYRAVSASGHFVGKSAAYNAIGIIQESVRFAYVFRRECLVLLVLVTVLPLGALVWRHWFKLETFDHTDVHVKDERVASLLTGEKLIPPAPLPPEVFLTREVALARPLARYASRDWMLLDEVFRQRVLMLYRIMQEQHGYDMVLLEGYRSPERQAQLAGLGSHVTQAGPGRSYHQHGLAVDSAFLRNGRVVISEQDPWAMRGYQLYGQTAALLGLTWGGDWKGLADYGHVELQRPGVLRPAAGVKGGPVP